MISHKRKYPPRQLTIGNNQNEPADPALVSALREAYEAGVLGGICDEIMRAGHDGLGVPVFDAFTIRAMTDAAVEEAA